MLLELHPNAGLQVTVKIVRNLANDAFAVQLGAPCRK
jgi:hypothetical protein